MESKPVFKGIHPASPWKGHWANIASQYSELLENNKNEGYWTKINKQSPHFFLSCSVLTHYKFSIVVNFCNNKKEYILTAQNLTNSKNYGEENLNYPKSLSSFISLFKQQICKIAQLTVACSKTHHPAMLASNWFPSSPSLNALLIIK